MNKFKSILLGSYIIVRSLNMVPSTKIEQTITHPRLMTPKVDYSKMTVKELKKLLTSKKVKGRSKLTKKAQMVKTLANL